MALADAGFDMKELVAAVAVGEVDGQVCVDLEYAEEELKKLQEEALSEYGTTDIQELKNILEEMEDKNQKLQSDYEDHLQKIETELAEIEENSKKQ